MKYYNYVSMIMLPLIDDIEEPKIVDKHLSGVFFNDHDDNFNYKAINAINDKCYVVLSAEGTADYISAVEKIKTLPQYIRSYDIAVGSKVFVFKIPEEFSSQHNLLLRGQYKFLSNDLRNLVHRYYSIWENIIDVPNRDTQSRGRTISLIASNSKFLLECYWEKRRYNDVYIDSNTGESRKISDEAHEYLLEQLHDSGNYWSAPTIEYQILNYKEENEIEI